MEEPSEARAGNVRAALIRILTRPTPADLWQLQIELLALGGELACKGREVAGEFHSCLRELQSKIASRDASRWAAVLETSSVTSVGLQEMIAEKEDPLQRILASLVTATLEVGAAAKNVQAWEAEARLMYYDVAWYLYGELWELSGRAHPKSSTEQRTVQIDRLVGPIIDPRVAEDVKSALLISLFQAVLVGWVGPLLAGTEDR